MRTHHVTVPIKGLDTGEKLLVIPERDQDLCVVADGLLENRERSLRNFMFFESPKLGLIELRFGNMDVLTENTK